MSDGIRSDEEISEAVAGNRIEALTTTRNNLGILVGFEIELENGDVLGYSDGNVFLRDD